MKNTALVNAPETLLTLMSVAEMARLHQVGTFIAVRIRRRLLANDGDLYFLRRREMSKLKRQDQDKSLHQAQSERPHNVLATTPRTIQNTETEHGLDYQCYLTWLLDDLRRGTSLRVE